MADEQDGNPMDTTAKLFNYYGYAPSDATSNSSEYDHNSTSRSSQHGHKEHKRQKEQSETWHKFYNLVEQHDYDMCKAWNDEIQNLLVFTGLFTAAVTAFVVEAYQWLQDDKGDETIKLLSQLMLHIVPTNCTQVSEIVNSKSDSIEAYMVRVNVFWFLSLTISLSAVVIGILCLQWLREFRRDAAMLPQDAISLRQLRY
ncbi:hypothetical protein AX16_005800 [Volvariella volvacea WC 439]|nr:hypothetical protein AX16_005800 [Volvariella volvacea WC 439]